VTAIDVEGLRMRYGDTDILHDVTFQVRPGEVVALLGPNGAGKTTTIEILEGFRMRSAGRVHVLGEDPAHAGEQWRAQVGVVLQSWRDHGKWRVRELLAHQASFYACCGNHPWHPDELIETVGLTEHAGQKLRTLSGGQRRRLDVALGIIGRPAILFLDEPTTGFDPQARLEFHELVRNLDTTILLTTHDLAEAEKLADRIVILNHGRIVADGTAYELARQIAGEDEVRWRQDGQQHATSTTRSTEFVHELFLQHGKAISELEVHRASLEQTYLALVQEAEAAR
jgi:ABC-2 type transport system ATP-binding protein